MSPENNIGDIDTVDTRLSRPCGSSSEDISTINDYTVQWALFHLTVHHIRYKSFLVKTVSHRGEPSRYRSPNATRHQVSTISLLRFNMINLVTLLNVAFLALCIVDLRRLTDNSGFETTAALLWTKCSGDSNSKCNDSGHDSFEKVSILLSRCSDICTYPSSDRRLEHWGHQLPRLRSTLRWRLRFERWAKRSCCRAGRSLRGVSF